MMDWSGFYNEMPCLLLKQGKYLIVGGLWGGRILVYNLETEKIVDSLAD